MRKWWDENPDKLNAILFCLVGLLLIAILWVMFLASVPWHGYHERDFSKEGVNSVLFAFIFISFEALKMLPPQLVNSTIGILPTTIQIGFAVLPWVFVITFSFFKKRILVITALLIFLGLSIRRTSLEFSYTFALSELYTSAYFLVSNRVGVYEVLIVFVLFGLILGLLFLPVKYRFDLFVTCIAIPVAGFIFLLALSFLFPHFNKNKNPDFAMSAARTETQHPVTFLMLAAGDGTPKEVKSQLASGIDIHAKNIYGTNALMYAALAGKSENVKVLLVAGARVNDQDDKGNTALSLARQQGHQEVVALLVTAGAKDMPLKP